MLKRARTLYHSHTIYVTPRPLTTGVHLAPRTFSAASVPPPPAAAAHLRRTSYLCHLALCYVAGLLCSHLRVAPGKICRARTILLPVSRCRPGSKSCSSAPSIHRTSYLLHLCMALWHLAGVFLCSRVRDSRTGLEPQSKDHTAALSRPLYSIISPIICLPSAVYYAAASALLYDSHGQ